MARIQGSTTSEAQYRLAVSQFQNRPEPPGTVLTRVCRGNIDHFDLAHDQLVLNPT